MSFSHNCAQARGQDCHHLKPQNFPALLERCSPKNHANPKNDPSRMPHNPFSWLGPYLPYTLLFSPPGPPSLPILTLSRFLYHC